VFRTVVGWRATVSRRAGRRKYPVPHPPDRRVRRVGWV